MPPNAAAVAGSIPSADAASRPHELPGWIVRLARIAIPLVIANAEERSLLLGISYVWMTAPIILGSALFVARAAHALAGRPRAAASSGAMLAAALGLLALTAPALAAEPRVFYAVLTA